MESPLRNIRNSLCLFKVQAAFIEEEEEKKNRSTNTIRCRTLYNSNDISVHCVCITKKKEEEEKKSNSPGQDTTFPVIVPPSTNNVLIDVSTSVRVKLIDSNIKKEEVLLFCIIIIVIVVRNFIVRFAYLYMYSLYCALLICFCFLFVTFDCQLLFCQKRERKKVILFFLKGGIGRGRNL